MTDQLTREDLAGMSPDAIVQAKNDGRLATLLGHGHDADLAARAARLEPITREELAQLNAAGRHSLAAAYANHPAQIIR